MSLSQRRTRLIGRLRVPKARAREGAVLAEGVRAVADALDAGVRVRFVAVSPGLFATRPGTELASRLRQSEGVEVVEVEDAELAELSATSGPQGVLLVCDEPEAAPTAIRSGGRYLVLDGVQDPGNAGTLVRASVAFGLDAVICLDGTVDPWGAKAVRASAGAVFRIPVVRVRAEGLLEQLGSDGVPLWVADATGDDIEKAPPAESFALAVGNEGGGVRVSLIRAASRRVAVPMPGPSESLNVAMAGSILLHVLTRERAP